MVEAAGSITWKTSLSSNPDGLETLDMARIHEQSVVSLDGAITKSVNGKWTGRDGAARKGSLPRPGSSRKRARVFFTRATGPIEQTHLCARESTIHLGILNAMLQRRTVDFAASKLRLKPGAARVVVLLSASGQEADVATAYRLGANAYLVKPSEASKFQEIARAIRDFWLMQNTPPPELPIESAAAVVKPEMPRSARIAAGGNGLTGIRLARVHPIAVSEVLTSRV